MPESLLQALLNRNLFELRGEDEQLGQLERAAVALAGTIRAELRSLPAYVLVALDPAVSPDDPCLAVAAQCVLREWRTFAQRYADAHPVPLLRAVIAEAVQRVTDDDDDCAAAAWLTAAGVAAYVPIGTEAPVWVEQLREWGTRTEAAGRAAWLRPDDPGNDGSDEEASGAWPTLAVRAGKVADLTHAFTAAAGPSGGAVGKITRNTNAPITSQYQVQHNPEWAAEFGQIAGREVTQAIAGALKSLAVDPDDVASLAAALAGHLAHVRMAGTAALATRRKTDALWWREALYSPLLERGYRGLDGALAAVAMAVDLTTFVPAPSPTSVEHLLREAVRALAVAAPPESLGACADAAVAALLALPADVRGTLLAARFPAAATDAPGRVPLAQYVLQASTPGRSAGAIEARLGVASTAPITLPEFAAWVYRDLQAARLVTRAASRDVGADASAAAER